MDIKDQIGKELVRQLKEGIIKRDLVSSKRLLNSVQYSTGENTVDIFANGYIYTLIPNGRRPNKSGKIGGFFEQILEWVQNKPYVVPAEMTPKSFAYATMVKISKEGNMMHREGRTPSNDGRLLEDLDYSFLTEISDEIVTKIIKNKIT